MTGAAGALICLDVETGAILWQKDYRAEYDSFVPTWGVASAPLVDGDRLIAVVGGEPGALVVAFDKRTGNELWRAVDVVSTVSTPPPSAAAAVWSKRQVNNALFLNS